MSLDPTRHASQPRGWARLVAVAAAVTALLFGGLGCEELSARRKIQEANKLYEGGRFQEAAALYEAAIKQAPDIDIAYYNAALNELKIFRPGVEDKENLDLAERITKYLSEWLRFHPDDDSVVNLMTQVWLDAGQYERAIQYWERELNKDRKNTEIIQILAGINRQAGNWDKAVDMYYLQADVEASTEGKANAYLNVARLAANKLYNRTEVYGLERLRVADIGIAALQKADALVKDNVDVYNYLGAVYSLRSEAHQAAWAQAIDKYTGTYHHKQWAALRKEAEAAAQPGGGGATPAPSGEGATPAPSGEGATPAPSGEGATPAPSGEGAAPAPSGEGAAGAAAAPGAQGTTGAGATQTAGAPAAGQ